MEAPKPGRPHLLAFIVLIAVAGLLTMHGLDGATATITDQAHSSHGRAQDGAPPDVLGLCVFVTVMARLGVAGARAPRRTHFTPQLPIASVPGNARTTTDAIHRARLAQLRVLRL